MNLRLIFSHQGEQVRLPPTPYLPQLLVVILPRHTEHLLGRGLSRFIISDCLSSLIHLVVYLKLATLLFLQFVVPPAEGYKRTIITLPREIAPIIRLIVSSNLFRIVATSNGINHNHPVN